MPASTVSLSSAPTPTVTAPSPATTVPAPVRPTARTLAAGELYDDRQFRRQAITEHFLTALEDVVWRYRALAGHPEHADLYAEVVTAEVAHQLEVTRQALRRTPSVG